MKVYRLCIPVRYRRIPDGAGYEGHGLCLVSFAGGRALQLHRRSTHGGGANSFFVVGFAVLRCFLLGLSFSTCLARQRRLELPPLFALMDEKRPTRIRLDTSTLHAHKSSPFGTISSICPVWLFILHGCTKL